MSHKVAQRINKATTPNNLTPTVSLDFKNGVYSGDTLVNMVTCTRAGATATDLTYTAVAGATYTTYAANALRIKAGWGLLCEDVHTNYLLNSAAPATQTTGTIPTGTWWLWVNGTGSATITFGTASGTNNNAIASQGLPATGTITVAGTVTITVTGSLNVFQLELGAAATSFIPTTGATVARGTETYSYAGNLLTVLSGSSGFFNYYGTGAFGVIIAKRNALTDVFGWNNGTTSIRAVVNGSGLVATSAMASDTYSVNDTGTGTTNSYRKYICAWGPSGVKVCFNNGPITRTPVKFGTTISQPNIGSHAGTSSLNGFIASITAGNYTPSDKAMQNASQAWSPSFTRFIGDSLTFGFASGYPYPQQGITLLPGGNQVYPFNNLGFTGYKSSDIITNWATQIAPYYDITIPNRVDVVWIGRNDLAAAVSVSDTFANVQHIWALSHSQGSKVIAVTLLPSVGGSISNAQYETNRQAVNVLIRNANAQYEAIMDIGADTTIGQNNQNTNSTYYTIGDNIHLVGSTTVFPNGDSVVAGYFYTAAAGLLY